MRRLILACLALWLGTSAQAVERDDYLDLARKGWSYELRTTMIGRDLAIPVRIHGRQLAGSALCVLGEEPHAATQEVLDAFRTLIAETYGKPLPMRFAGHSAAGCGSGRTVLLRLYSGRPPNRALTQDVNWMNGVYRLGLPLNRDYAAMSPAMAQTFFGHLGQATHIMVKQPGLTRMGEIEETFYRSILVEELFQAFTFGMDVLQFDSRVEFLSKLQERPVNMGRLSWSSQAFMRALLGSNPKGLCRFDVFMLHAVAQAPVDQTNSPDFIDFIETHYDRLRAQAETSFNDPRFAPIVDMECAAVRRAKSN